MSLREQLIEVRATFGRLTPATVVDAARAADHPLHHRFEWDDSVASEAYRRVQAAELIRSCRITYTSPATNEPRSVRAFHSTIRPDHATPVYEPLEEIVTDDVARQVLIAEMRRDWARFQARYSHLAEYIELIEQAAKDAA